MIQITIRLDQIQNRPLFLRAEFALEPGLRLGAIHWIWLTAIDAAQLAPARPLIEHKPHWPMALRTDRRKGMNLRHLVCTLDQAGAQYSQSPVGAQGGAVMSVHPLKLHRYSILLIFEKLMY